MADDGGIPGQGTSRRARKKAQTKAQAKADRQIIKKGGVKAAGKAAHAAALIGSGGTSAGVQAGAKAGATGAKAGAKAGAKVGGKATKATGKAVGKAGKAGTQAGRKAGAKAGKAGGKTGKAASKLGGKGAGKPAGGGRGKGADKDGKKQAGRKAGKRAVEQGISGKQAGKQSKSGLIALAGALRRTRKRFKKKKRRLKIAIFLLLLLIIFVLLFTLLIAIAGGDYRVVSSYPEQGRKQGVPSSTLWIAYQSTSLLWCHPASGDVWLGEDTNDDGGRSEKSGWYQVDWRLVAAVGKIESNHAVGRTVNEFGDVRPWIVGPPLDGSGEGLAVIDDTDGGRWDLDFDNDRAVGPMQFLPGTFETLGVDANRDGMADPQNVWDATMSTARYLCISGVGESVEDALLTYNNSDEYVENVLTEYLVLADAVSGDGLLRRPDGLPLGFEVVEEDSPLEEVPVMMASVVQRWIDVTGGAIDPEEVVCGEQHCSWATSEAPDLIVEWEEYLDGFGEVAVVVTREKILFTGDPARWVEFPTVTPDVELAWPLHLAAPPEAVDQSPDGLVPEETEAPGWWDFHLPVDEGAWTTSPTATLPVIVGASVGYPTTGETVEGSAEGCVGLVDGDDWLWELCGVTLLDDPAPVEAGNPIGESTGTEIVVSLTAPSGSPDGEGAQGNVGCVGVVFQHWKDGMALSPQQIEDEWEAREEQARQQAEEAAAEAAAEAEENGEEPPEPVEYVPEPNPMREC